MLAYVDYALIIVFFVVLLGLMGLILTSRPEAVRAETKALPPVQENKLAYGFLAGVLVLLFVLTFVIQRQQAHPGS
jgi:protein-S-isoprenylcysteine O-methyltransferase Ste14